MSTRQRIRIVVPVINSETELEKYSASVLAMLEKYKAQDTELNLVAIANGPETIECNYDVAWAELFTVKEVERAEAEGYDGVIIYCFSDPGLSAAKEVSTIPVVGIGEASMHIASMLGNKFSVINPTVTLTDTIDKVRLSGLDNRCASIRPLSIPVAELGVDEIKEAKRLLEEAKKAIKDDGSDTIVLGCSDMGGGEELARKLGAPVVIPGIAGLKVCEALIRMGLTQSKIYFSIPPKKKRLLG